MTTRLSPLQMQLVQMFSYQNDEKTLEEMRDILLNYLHEKIMAEGKRLWEEKGMSNELMDEWLNTHIRTPYNL